METKDWKKEAWALHLEFHRYMEDLERQFSSETEEGKKAKDCITTLHSLFDTVILWVEKLSDEKLKLEGAIKEARRYKPFTKPPPFERAETEE